VREIVHLIVGSIAPTAGWPVFGALPVRSPEEEVKVDIDETARGSLAGGTPQLLSGPTASPVKAWTHVALTYDSAALRLYVNGRQVASRAASGAIETNDNPLWIGGNQPYGEYFTGLIDDVRVYSRALRQADIQKTT
jgi:hypothetical protein